MEMSSKAVQSGSIKGNALVIIEIVNLVFDLGDLTSRSRVVVRKTGAFRNLFDQTANKSGDTSSSRRQRFIVFYGVVETIGKLRIHVVLGESLHGT